MVGRELVPNSWHSIVLPPGTVTNMNYFNFNGSPLPQILGTLPDIRSEVENAVVCKLVHRSSFSVYLNLLGSRSTVFDQHQARITTPFVGSQASIRRSSAAPNHRFELK